MLVMTVKEGDYIKIGDDIRIEVIKDMSAGSIKVGVDAPKSTKILRSKLYESELMEDSQANKEELEMLAKRKESAKRVIEERQKKTAEYKEARQRKHEAV